MSGKKEDETGDPSPVGPGDNPDARSLGAYDAENPVPDAKAYSAAYHMGILKAISSPGYVLLSRSDASQQYLDHFIDEYAALFAKRVLQKREEWPPAS